MGENIGETLRKMSEDAKQKVADMVDMNKNMPDYKSEEPKREMAWVRACKNCGNEFVVENKYGRKRLFCDLKCKAKFHAKKNAMQGNDAKKRKHEYYLKNKIKWNVGRKITTNSFGDELISKLEARINKYQQMVKIVKKT